MNLDDINGAEARRYAPPARRTIEVIEPPDETPRPEHRTARRTPFGFARDLKPREVEMPLLWEGD